MLKRLVIASAGAVIVTIALLLMMNRAANHIIIQDPVQYFGIADFIPYTGARRPPPRPELQPRPALPPAEETDDPAQIESLPLDRPEPNLPEVGLPPSELVRPGPDEPAVQ